MEKKKFQINTKMAVIIAVVIIILACVYFFRGLFIAATVNGEPISRFAVIGKLEAQGGKSTLSSLIDEKLIEAEARKQKVIVSQSDVDAKVKGVEDQISSTGGTLDAALEGQGMTRADLENEIRIQLLAEKILADKTTVTDAEIDQYIKDNKVTITKANASSTRADIETTLSGQKFQTAAGTWLDGLRTSAKINYLVKY